jgi:hypothetical protein
MELGGFERPDVTMFSEASALPEIASKYHCVSHNFYPWIGLLTYVVFDVATPSDYMAT